jgi:hypothetical protein
MESPRPKKQPFGVDDMMDRLKTRSSGGSRVVGVESVDGEHQEVRKKRKRRSHQPKKVREARIAWGRKLILYGVIPLIVLAIIGWYVMILRYKGESCRSDVSERVSSILGLKTEVATVVPDGFSVNSRRIYIEGNPGTILRNIEVMDVISGLNMGSHFSKNWDINVLQVRTCRFGLQEVAGLARLDDNDDRPFLKPDLPLMMAGLGLNPTPESFNIDFLRLGNCEVVWHPLDEDLSAVRVLENSLITSSNFGQGNDFVVTLGHLALPKWPDLDIDHGKFKMTSSGIQIEEIRLQRGSYGDLDGVIRGMGSISFGSRPTANLDFDFKNVDVRDFLPETWQDKVIGKISGKMKTKSIIGLPESFEADGEISMPGGVLGGLTSLKLLSNYAGDAKLARIFFEKHLTARFRMDASGAEFFDISGEAPDLFGVKGSVKFLADGRITGQVDVGVSEEILVNRKGGKPPFFGAVEKDLYWTPVILSGKRERLEDDLSTRFEAHIRAEEQSANDELQRRMTPNAQGAAPAPPSSGNPLNDQQKQTLESAFDKLLGE